jgi:sortase A
MLGRKLKQLISFALIAGGVFLVFRGARDLLESRWGQLIARRHFEPSLAQPQPQRAHKRVRPHLGDTVAKLVIPRLDTELYVVEGVDQADLRRGPGHMPGTAMPGDRGNCVIAAHRDLHFRVLKDIQQGDDIVLETPNGDFLYRVKTMRIVAPNNTTPIKPTPSPELHLITCYPFYYLGHAPKRFIVEAALAGPIDASVAPPSNQSASPTLLRTVLRLLSG